MTTPAPLILPLHDCRDTALAGGKAVNLSVLLRAGFTVPDGFVVTTAAYRSRGDGAAIPPTLAEAILLAWRAMGSPPVAVRSSATAEDMSEASMAGQYETYLDIRDEATLLDRIAACWGSLDSPRTRAYLKEHGIELAHVAMAVVVQRLVSAEVAGVLFSANPQTGSRTEMLVEASWGLGEAVVSGMVQPDVLRIERASGRVLEARIADKQVMISPGGHAQVAVPDDRRQAHCLRGADVQALWKLGLKAADHFGSPQDIEWAIDASGQLYLLQSRPITTLAEAESYELCLQSARSHLRARLDAGRGPWVIHNLAETLPHPTPLTWSVIKRFMCGSGGFGVMYRLAGFEPSPLVCREGFLDLVAGRIYMDAALCPEMFFEGFPFRYDVDELRHNPDAAQSPPTIPCGPVSARMKMARRAARASAIVQGLADGYDVQLTGSLIPAFVRWVDQQKAIDLQALTTDQLIELWRAREQRVMQEFAPQSLLPSLISGAALADLRNFLEECFWDQDPDELVHLLSSAHEADETVQANAMLFQVANGHAPVEEWLAQYGHRGSDEFDLAAPRWRQRPADLLAMAHRLRGGADPAHLHQQHLTRVNARLEQLRSKLSGNDADELDRRVNLARRYMRFREDGKYYLMLGYELLRDVALEAGRRLEIGDDVFMLSIEELIDALTVGYAPHHLIAQRKVQRRAEKKVTLPHVIDATNLDEIGSPPRVAGDGAIPAFAISPGVASGPARIVRSPDSAPADLGSGYILVCPSTDPSWTPLFTNAAGLVLECGGTLSHGAVVAREMSIPAVVLRDACAIIREGEALTLDGRQGMITRGGQGSGTATDDAGRIKDEPKGSGASHGPETGANGGQRLTHGSSSTRIARDLIPPPSGRKDRRAAKLRNVMALGWGVYLALAFLLPEDWFYQPSMAILDAVLWPLVRLAGHAGAAAIIAGGMGALTMVMQKLLTDNRRLVVAKQRAAALTQEARALPADSPRGQALLRLASPVQMRVLGAAMVPLALILGPMIMIFMWLPARVDIAAWNAPAGTPVDVVAMVRPDAGGKVTLELPAALTLDETTPATQGVPDVRAALERYRQTQLKPSDLSALPWELREAAESRRVELIADLDSYLREIPPVPVTWKVRTPEKAEERWPIAIKSSNGATVSSQIVLGNRFPPGNSEITGLHDGPLTSARILYPPAPTRQHFLMKPIRIFGTEWEPGWLTVYLLAYLPAMFLTRIALKVA